MYGSAVRVVQLTVGNTFQEWKSAGVQAEFCQEIFLTHPPGVERSEIPGGHSWGIPEGKTY